MNSRATDCRSPASTGLPVDVLGGRDMEKMSLTIAGDAGFDSQRVRIEGMTGSRASKIDALMMPVVIEPGSIERGPVRGRCACHTARQSSHSCSVDRACNMFCASASFYEREPTAAERRKASLQTQNLAKWKLICHVPVRPTEHLWPAHCDVLLQAMDGQARHSFFSIQSSLGSGHRRAIRDSSD